MAVSTWAYKAFEAALVSMFRVNATQTDEAIRGSRNSAVHIPRGDLDRPVPRVRFDLLLFVLRKRLSEDAFYRLGDHFRWIIPAASVPLVLFAGLAFALIAVRVQDGSTWESS